MEKNVKDFWEGNAVEADVLWVGGAEMCRLGVWGGVAPPNRFTLARKLVKSQPCRKGVGQSIFCDLVLVTRELIPPC